ncbi:hypothetical protein ONZ51_g7927 [Trametes cubensis]|uniref:YDG domain-containing protein n=1 Tax=Trametes cubensis TaxID=1111947 RepID=A0AAD7TRQ7_9APHY|nr:hypothetical protein ONZ51_g7927 [Trametes cubensis]
MNMRRPHSLFLHHSSVHSGILAGIAGSKHEGCYSVVLSGGYEDDKDDGYTFTYTGCGGRDKKSGEKPREGPQTCDQSWSNSRNMSLKVSAYTKKPVRVIRGYKSSSDFAPAQGYRYDGLYVVEKAWMDVGKSGFKVCKYLLKRLPNQPPIPRRQGTLHLDLSEWERPIHFGRDASADTDSESNSESDSDPERPRERYSDKLSSRTRSASPPRKRPIPIPPTTNVRAAERRVGGGAQQRLVTPPQAPAEVSQPDVHAILAEWKGPGMSTQARSVPAHKSTEAIERPCPTRPLASGRSVPGQAGPSAVPTPGKPT